MNDKDGMWRSPFNCRGAFDYDEVFGTTTTYMVLVGDIDAYEVEAEDEQDAVDYLVRKHIITKYDLQRYRKDPSYIQVVRKDEY